MIMVADPTKPFTYSAKRSLKRPIILQDYEKEIEELYAAAEEQLELVPPTDWTLPNSLKFVRAAVFNVLKQTIADNQDIFEAGCDRSGYIWLNETFLNIPYRLVYRQCGFEDLLSRLARRLLACPCPICLPVSYTITQP
jgi:hypothetical protein